MASVVALVSAAAVSSGRLLLPQAVPSPARVRQVSGLSGADVIVTINGHTTAFIVMQAGDWGQHDYMDRYERPGSSLSRQTS